MNKSEAGKLGVMKSKEIAQKQKEERIEQYNQNPTLCKYCGKPLPYKNRHRKFCNNTCAGYYNNQHYDIQKPHADYGTCLNCGKPKKRKSSKYCCIKCSEEYKSRIKYEQEIQQWKDGTLAKTWNPIGNVIGSIKRYLLQKYNYKCSKCGWGEINPYTGKLPLEVHHIDGDWQNNTEENLTILCPNCHSLTPNYKASNKGNGRQFRQKKV